MPYLRQQIYNNMIDYLAQSMYILRTCILYSQVHKPVSMWLKDETDTTTRIYVLTVYTSFRHLAALEEVYLGAVGNTARGIYLLVGGYTWVPTCS